MQYIYSKNLQAFRTYNFHAVIIHALCKRDGYQNGLTVTFPTLKWSSPLKYQHPRFFPLAGVNVPKMFYFPISVYTDQIHFAFSRTFQGLLTCQFKYLATIPNITGWEEIWHKRENMMDHMVIWTQASWISSQVQLCYSARDCNGLIVTIINAWKIKS